LIFRVVDTRITKGGSLQKTDFAEYVAGLSSDQQERLASQLIPLSFAQQRMWFLDQLEPGSSAYNTPVIYKLKGRLDLPAFEASLNEIMKRHEALRTIFMVLKDEPFQIILPPHALPLRLADIRRLPEEVREIEAERLSAGESQVSFDMSRGPLIRVTLLRLTDEEYIFLLTAHHVVCDGWSVGIFLQELATLYRASVAGKPSSLPELPIQYADFALWQRQWLRGEILENQLSYGKHQLADVPALRLPTDHPRPAAQTFRGAIRLFRIPVSLSEPLKALSLREEATLFMTLLAAFQTLLYRYTGQDDISVGTPISGRNRVETEGLIGAFINVLVLRTDLSGNPTFRELLHRVRNVCLEGYAYQDVPFEQLTNELRLQRDLSRTPLFQVMCVLQNMPVPVPELPGLTIIPEEIDPGTSKYDVSIDFLEDASGVCGGILEYNTDLFEPETMSKLIDDLIGILTEIAENISVRINDIDLRHGLSVAEPVGADEGDFVF
jgi:hypothetical protein